MTFLLRAKKVAMKARMPDGKSHWRLHSVDLACGSGERIGIVGANGAGKSSLARVLSGLERPTRGRVRVHPRGSQVMLIMQRAEEHFVSATVHEEISGFSNQPIERRDAERLLAAVGLPGELASMSPRRLSTGQQRAVTLACAFASAPAMLILDEPMAGLDATGRREALRALRFLSERRDLSICMISHHPDDLLGWAKRLWILADGYLVYDGDLDAAPVDKLSRSLDTTGSSLYFALRRLEERGWSLPREIYTTSSPEDITQLLEKASLDGHH